MATTQNDLLAAKTVMSRRYLSKAAPSGITTFGLAMPLKAAQNVVGVGVGTKFSEGKETNTKCVRFYVREKIGLDALATKDVLPQNIDGVPTDVIVTGKFRMFDTAANNKQRRRPVRPGLSIGFKFPPGPKSGFVMAGTLGAVVTKDGKTFLLSNNHVLAENGQIDVGAPIFQPGLLDSGSEATDQIASMTRFIPIKPTGFNKVDCAIAEVLAQTKIDPRVMPRVGRLGSTSPIAAASGMEVEKSGRTTGYTRGTVFDVAADVNVDYEDKDGNSFTASFDNQILVVTPGGSFSAAGDSGSLIVDRSSKRATGLLFAGSSTHTIANHFADVLAALGVSLVA
jgi:hypothetical protein